MVAAVSSGQKRDKSTLDTRHDRAFSDASNYTHSPAPNSSHPLISQLSRTPPDAGSRSGTAACTPTLANHPWSNYDSRNVDSCWSALDCLIGDAQFPARALRCAASRLPRSARRRDGRESWLTSKIGMFAVANWAVKRNDWDLAAPVWRPRRRTRRRRTTRDCAITGRGWWTGRLVCRWWRWLGRKCSVRSRLRRGEHQSVPSIGGGRAGRMRGAGGRIPGGRGWSGWWWWLVGVVSSPWLCFEGTNLNVYVFPFTWVNETV